MDYAFKKPAYKILIPLLDILGSIIFFPLRILSKPIPSNPKKIVVVRLDHIGDFVCTTPIFKNIKKRFPDAKITVIVNSASKELAYRNPNIDKVISFSPFYLARGEKASTLKGLMRVAKDVRALSFDLGIEPRGDILSILLMWLGGVRYRIGYGITGGGFLLHAKGRYDKSKHIIDRNLDLLELLNIPVLDRLPEVNFNDKDMDIVEGLLKELGVADKKSLVLHPFAGAKAKEWPRDNFQSLIGRIKESDINILLIGSEDDEGIFSDVIDLRGRLNLPRVAYLIKRIGLFVGLDSGPANMAAALNVPSVIICSGTNIPQLWIPNGPNVKLIYKDTECKPCGLKVCKKEKHECMDSITVEEVYGKFIEITNGKMGQSPSGTVPIFPKRDCAMKIYFDARMIGHPGIGRYIRCLLRLMAEERSLDLHLLGDRTKIKKFLNIDSNIIDFDHPIYSIQEQIGFLRIKNIIGNDILHVPHYNIPLLAKFNLITTVHDLIHITYPGGASGRLAPLYMKFMVKRILRSARAVICVSQATKDEIEKRFIQRESKLHVIYEGVDDVFRKMDDTAYLKSVKEKYALPDKFLLYVGSVRRHKNIGALLDAFSGFKKKVPDISLIMVGRHSQEIDIKRTGVTYLGEIESDKELAAIYNLASCLFNLSLYEGFGLTILEAQKCGLPVVCSDIAVHKEIGTNGIAAVGASYIDQICDNLYNILSNKAIREPLILRGLKNADRFDWHKTALKSIDLYRKTGNESSDSSRLASGDAGRGKNSQCLL